MTALVMAKDIEDFKRDGAVCLRGLFKDWDWFPVIGNFRGNSGWI